MGSMLSSVVPETEIEGYHILHMYEKSPAKDAGLEAFFDFIVALCGVVLIGNHEVFLKLLKHNLGTPIEAKVFSIKTRTFRNVRVTPSNKWGGQGLLGLTLNFCAVKDAYNFIQHILTVYPNSPANSAGLQPFSDYIIGAQTEREHNNIDFMTFIKEHDQRPVKLFVYNFEKDECRAVIIKPNSRWGGSGALGCDIGTGYLHRIPTLSYKSRNSMLSASSKNLMSTQLSKKPQLVVRTVPFVPAAKAIKLPNQEHDPNSCTVNIENEKKQEIEIPAPKISYIKEETIA